MYMVHTTLTFDSLNSGMLIESAVTNTIGMGGNTV